MRRMPFLTGFASIEVINPLSTLFVAAISHAGPTSTSPAPPQIPAYLSIKLRQINIATSLINACRRRTIVGKSVNDLEQEIAQGQQESESISNCINSLLLILQNDTALVDHLPGIVTHIKELLQLS